MTQGPTIILDPSQPRTLTESWKRTLTLTHGVFAYHMANKSVRKAIRRVLLFAYLVLVVVDAHKAGEVFVMIVIALPFYVGYRIAKRVKKALDTPRKA